MTTGDYLVSHSTLTSGTALEHLLAMQTGSGQGTVFASMFSVRIEESRTTLLRRPGVVVANDEQQATRAVDDKPNELSVFLAQEMTRVFSRGEALTVAPAIVRSMFVIHNEERLGVRANDSVGFN